MTDAPLQTEPFQEPEVSGGLEARDPAPGLGEARTWAEEKAGAAREWAATKAGALREVIREEPKLTLTVSTAAALAVGLFAGFLLARLTED